MFDTLNERGPDGATYSLLLEALDDCILEFADEFDIGAAC